MKTLTQRLAVVLLPLITLFGTLTLSAQPLARTERVIIENGSNALSNEEARQIKNSGTIPGYYAKK